MKTSEDSSSNVKSPVTQPLGAYKAAIPSKARGVFKVAVGDVRVQRDASNARDVLRGASGKTSANTYNRIFGDRKRASDGRIVCENVPGDRCARRHRVRVIRCLRSSRGRKPKQRDGRNQNCRKQPMAGVHHVC